MAGNLFVTSRKLLTALNSRGHKLTFNTKQFMGTEGRPHNYYSICKATYSKEHKKYMHSELYSTSSMVRIVLFLRDMWYLENGWELPTDQKLWNSIREDLEAKKKYG